MNKVKLTNKEADYIKYYKKKLKQFISEMMRKVEDNFREFNRKNLDKTVSSYCEIYENVVLDLYKLGADYMEFSSLMKLKTIIEQAVFKNCLTPESAMMIFMKEDYAEDDVLIYDISELQQ